MHKFFQTIFSFIFNFYKFIWFKFLKLSKAGKILAVSFLVFVFAISSLVANSSQNNSQVLGKTSQNQSKISSQNSSFSQSSQTIKESSSQNSINLMSLSLELENSSQNSSQNSLELTKFADNSQKTASASANSEISNQNQNQNLDKTTDLSIDKNSAQNLDKKLYDVLQVVDGDTIKISEIGTLRLIGIDTPETKDPRKVVQCFGKEASNKAVELLANKKVYLEFDKSKPLLDKYQRTLAYVFREDGYFYNLEMVKDGFAHSYKQYPHPKLDEFNSAENSARNEKKGFWADNTCGGNTEQGTSGEITKKAVPPTGGTQTNQEIPKTEIIKPAAGNFDTNGDGKITCKDFKGQVTDSNILALYPKLDNNSDGVGCESNR